MDNSQLTPTELLIIAVKNGQYPKRLFKYRAIDENTKTSLKEAKFWFAKPSTFNDPLDCNLSFSHQQDINKYKLFLKRIGMEFADIKKSVNQIKRNPKRLSNQLHKHMNNTLNKHGLFSLSKNKDNILMWSHYSDHHEGIVIEFDVLDDPSFFEIPIHVKYQENYIPLKYYENPEHAVTKTISTKSNLWSYEEEIRVMKMPGLHSIKREAIKSIYFGCNAKSSAIKDIIKLCKAASYPNIKFYKASIKHGKFALSFSKCK